MIGVVLLAVVPTLVLSLLQSPLYAGQAEVLLRPTGTSGGARADESREMQSEIRILESRPVRALVQERLGPAPAVTGAPIAGTDLMRVTAKSTDPTQAALIADTYATVYIEYRRRRALEELTRAAEQVQGRLAELEGQAAQSPAGPSRDALIQAQTVLRQELEQLQSDARTQGGAQLVTQATVPTDPVAPRPLRNAGIALALGVVLGLGIAFVVEVLDDSVKSKAQFERIAPGVPVIGLIPLVGAARTDRRATVVSLNDPASPAAEAYRALRTGVQAQALDRPLRTLQITSPNAGEGKTTTAANLGLALARAGQRVVVVCCDLRRPRLHEFFGVTNGVGFTSVMLGKVPLSRALQEVPGHPRLNILTSGPLPPNPSELLSSKRSAEVLTTLQIATDIVVLDSPPVLPVTDALVLSRRVDATLLVCTLRATTQREAERSVELLAQVGAPVVGAVLNGVTHESPDAYGYGYYVKATSSTGRQRPTEGETLTNTASARKR